MFTQSIVSIGNFRRLNKIRSSLSNEIDNKQTKQSLKVVFVWKKYSIYNEEIEFNQFIVIARKLSIDRSDRSIDWPINKWLFWINKDNKTIWASCFRVRIYCCSIVLFAHNNIVVCVNRRIIVFLRNRIFFFFFEDSSREIIFAYRENFSSDQTFFLNRKICFTTLFLIFVAEKKTKQIKRKVLVINLPQKKKKTMKMFVCFAFVSYNVNNHLDNVYHHSKHKGCLY